MAFMATPSASPSRAANRVMGSIIAARGPPPLGYNSGMEPRLPRPDGERLGAMVALVLLASGLSRIVQLPAVEAEFGLLGLLVRLRLDTQFVMLTLAAGLAFTGVDWLLPSHPRVVPAGAWAPPLRAPGGGCLRHPAGVIGHRGGRLAHPGTALRDRGSSG